MHTLVIGAGFSGAYIARKALESGSVSATRRSSSSLDELAALGVRACAFDGLVHPVMRETLQGVTHLVISVPPDRAEPFNDPVLNTLGELGKNDMPALQWIGYLSTIGVYGDHAGAWIDETAPCISVQVRSRMRLQAEIAWRRFAVSHKVPLSVLRLSGIYGPGRNALEDALRGRARVLIKPEQVFNRIHVHDLAKAALLAAAGLHDGILNITDNLPAPPQDVIRFAHDLLDEPYPQPQDFASADISDMARSFYSENKRISNTMSKSALGMHYRYATYKEGLESLLDSMRLT